jgi:hypothetical protein
MAALFIPAEGNQDVDLPGKMAAFLLHAVIIAR